ncbi:MAG: hypothetical protein ACOH2V_10475 [Candidatus Saccharimonadaceae bacterium]
MNWSKKHIAGIVADLAEDNAFACRALFKVSKIVFSDRVATLAVSIASKPVLFINLEFLGKNARSENDVKALLMHEFLHVILLHTEKFKSNSPLLNIALDAVINAVIHRTYGSDYSDFFSRFYGRKGIDALLRPLTQNYGLDNDWYELNQKIYSGKFAADDLHELLEYLAEKGKVNGAVKLVFIGNHSFEGQTISSENSKLLDGILSRMDGTGIWNRPGERGSNERLDDDKARVEKLKINRWRFSAYGILKKCMEEDKMKSNSVSDAQVLIPVLSGSDRRAFSYFSWSGIIPLATHTASGTGIAETVNIYLDVSGSMSAEIDQLVSLLYRFRELIRTPIWVFSNKVAAASFNKGSLVYQTTNGTSISCVFDHIRSTGSRKNLIVTDGYTEPITEQMLTGISLENLWTIISAKGNASEFSKNQLKYLQLKKI